MEQRVLLPQLMGVQPQQNILYLSQASRINMKAQVYLVTNNINNKQYVGQTINPHLPIGHGRLLKTAYKKHGKDNFIYEPICTEIGDRQTLNYIERFWISTFNTVVPNGYNFETGGSDGQEWSGARRKAQSERRIGKPLNRPLGSKSGMKGKKYPEEGKRKLSEALKGRPSPNWGKKASKETKQKMSDSQKKHWASLEVHPNFGKKASAETLEKKRLSALKRTHGDLTKQKISESIKQWHQKRKESICL